VHRSPALIPLLLALLAPSPGRAVGYDFVVVASDQGSGAFASLSFLTPSIGNDGGVTFLATPRSSSEAAIFAGARPGRRLADYARVTPPGSPSVLEIGTSIGGAVAYAGGSGATSGVYRASLGVVSPILLTSQQIEPAVNASGVLAYVDGNGALEVADAQGSTILIQSGDQVAGGRVQHVFSFVLPDINDAGQVAFWPLIFFSDPTCDEPIMRTTLGGAEVVATGGADTCDFVDAGDVPLAINELGQVAYAARLDDAIEGLVDTVTVDSSKVWDARDPAFADPVSGTLPHVTDVALNDSGKVAFRIEGSGTSGVYTGSDPVSDKVLAKGDALCASTVTSVRFQRYGIDPLGRLALFVSLADGRQLIVRADEVLDSGGACNAVPEPGPIEDAVAAVAALLGVAAAVRRRTTRPRAARS
jgi:hypothetical protein